MDAVVVAIQSRAAENDCIAILLHFTKNSHDMTLLHLTLIYRAGVAALPQLLTEVHLYGLYVMPPPLLLFLKLDLKID